MVVAGNKHDADADSQHVDTGSRCIVVNGPRQYGFFSRQFMPGYLIALTIVIGVNTAFSFGNFGLFIKVAMLVALSAFLYRVAVLLRNRIRKKELALHQLRSHESKEAKVEALRLIDGPPDISFSRAKMAEAEADWRRHREQSRRRSIVITDDRLEVPSIIRSSMPFEPVHARSEADRIVQILTDALPEMEGVLTPVNRQRQEIVRFVQRACIGSLVAIIPAFVIFATAGVIRVWGLPGFWAPIVMTGIGVALSLRLMRSEIVIAPRLIVARKRPWHAWEIMRPDYGGLFFDARDGEISIPRSSLGPMFLRCDLATGLLAAWAWVSAAEPPDDKEIRRYVGIGRLEAISESHVSK